MKTPKDAASYYRRRGWRVVPVSSGAKGPTITGWNTRDFEPEEFADGDNIGIQLGSVSGGLVDIDLDCQEAVEAAKEILPQTAVTGRQGNEGSHYWFVCPGIETKKYQDPLLADQQKEAGEDVHCTILEIRGESKTGKPLQTIVGPSVVDGNRYDCLVNVPAEITAEELNRLCRLIADEVWRQRYGTTYAPHGTIPAPWQEEPHKLPQIKEDGTGETNETRPGDVYNQRGDCRDVLSKHGWRQIRAGENEYWRRPGKNSGNHSATFKDGCFYVFSTGAAPFDADTGYSQYGVYATLEHGGDFTSATKALAAEGYEVQPNMARVSHGREVAESFFKADDEYEKVLIAKDPGQYPEEILTAPGLIEQVTRFSLDSAIYPSRALSFAGALAFVATLLGHKVRDKRDTRTNLLIFVLADSGSGKNNARKICKRLLHDAGLTECIGPDRLSSHSGITKQLGIHPIMLFQPDEIHALMGDITKRGAGMHLAHIPEVIKEAYSSAGELWKPTCYSDSKANVEINQPHAVFHATGIPEQFWLNVSRDIVTSGFLGRVLMFDIDEPTAPMRDSEHLETPHELLESIAWWRDFRPPGGNLQSQFPRPQFVHPSPEANKRMQGHFETIRMRASTEDYVQSAIWSRSGEKTAQLSLLLACSRCTGPKAPELRIELEDVERAIAINNHSTRKIVYRAKTGVAETENEKETQRMLKTIGNKWIARSLITRKNQRVNRHLRNQILQDLVESGEVLVEERGEGSARAEFFKRA